MENLKYSIIAILVSFIVSLIIGRFLIPELKAWKFGQNIREDGPQTHMVKNGIPTMGGLIFVLANIFTILVIGLVFKYSFSYYIIIYLVVFIGFCLIGLVDDYLNVKRETHHGLSAKQKLIAQFAIALITYYIFRKVGVDSTLEILTFQIDLGRFYVLYILLMIVGFSNAVNITDGVDGLAAGLSIIAFIVYGLISWKMSLYIPDLSDIAIGCFTLVGAILGFLFYNFNPAKVFMGDTGSLALGAVLAIVAILTKHDVTLLIVGGVFVLEIVSVILQVASFKLTKKRVFLMAPLHHHFELLGWSEVQIVKMFWALGIIFGLMGILFGVLS